MLLLRLTDNECILKLDRMLGEISLVRYNIKSLQTFHGVP